MKIRLGLSFYTDQGARFFGEGPYRLLRGVEELGSLRASTQRMDMAYTKAFNLIKNAEAALGFPLIQRTIGGKGGGGSVLTPQAKELLTRYESYRDACGDMAERLYDQYFSTFPPAAPAADGREGPGQDKPDGGPRRP